MEKSTHKPTYKELEACLKKAERRARKAEASLEKSKEEKDDLKRKIKELEKTQKPKILKKSMFDSGTDGYYTERVERHTYPSYTILAGLMLYMYAGCSYRQVVKVMEVMSKVFSSVLPWIFKDKPSHACIEDWAEKAGLAAMRSKPKTLEGAYALILDESVDIGENNIVMTLKTRLNPLLISTCVLTTPCAVPTPTI